MDILCLSYFANYSQKCTSGRFETSGSDASTCASLSGQHCSRICGAKCSADGATYNNARLACSYADTTCTFVSSGGSIDGAPAAAESPAVTDAGTSPAPGTTTPGDSSDTASDSTPGDGTSDTFDEAPPAPGGTSSDSG